MKIGLPKEIKSQEKRVALVPSGADSLVKAGHQVFVETDAGLGAGFQDEAYTRAGATIVQSPVDVFGLSEMIVKVKEPQPQEYDLFRPGHLLFTYLHLAATKKLTDVLLEEGVTSIAYETIEINGRLPLLQPMSEIAGRISVLVGVQHLATFNGGCGVLLPGAPGVLPGRVLVIGGGVAGVNAARMAVGLGAKVIILEVNLDRVRALEATMDNVCVVYSNDAILSELLPRTDLLIGAVLIPGARAPKLVTRDMLRLMKPGSVVVDIAVDQGGCIETTRPTTHENPTFIEEGVVHYCVTNMPGAYARTSTLALTNATLPYILVLAGNSLDKACQLRPELVGGVNVMDNHVTNQAVADAHGMSWISPEACIAVQH